MRGHDITEPSSRVRRAGLGGRAVPRGPQPVRPRVVAVGVRPVQPAWPASAPARLPAEAPAAGWRASALGVGHRVLARRTAVVRGPVRLHPRAVLAGAGLMVATAAAVFGLGLLADVVADARAPAPAPAAVTAVGSVRTVTVTVTDETTVWEVAERVLPGASGAEVAAAAERIVTGNGLSTVRVRPGQVLRVTAG